MAKPRLTAVGYLRISSRSQSGEGRFGLDVQRAAVTKYAKANGMRLVGFCEDVVSGTTDLCDRDGLGCVLDHLADGTATVVIVPRLDRLARDVITQETLLREVRLAGGDLRTCAEAEAHFLEDDPNDPSRQMIRVILGAVASYERQMICLRMKGGRRRKREAGGYDGGAPAFGHRAEGGSLVADDDEQAVIAMMLAMRQNGSSLRDIAAHLNDQGIPTKRGSKWSASTVSRVIDPEARERDRARADHRRTHARSAPR